jgi:hypothetical protein
VMFSPESSPQGVRRGRRSVFDGLGRLVYSGLDMSSGMTWRKKRNIGRALAVIAWLGLLLSAGPGCKNSTTPDGNAEARIIVYNNCGIAVDVYLDDAFQFYLEQKEYYYIENFSLGTHELKAKKKGTDILLKSTTGEFTQKQDYTWTISSTAVVTITNNYGETLSLYGDGTYQTDIPDQSSAQIPDIPYGEHTLEAKRPNQTEVLASKTIDVLGDNVYSWTITK